MKLIAARKQSGAALVTVMIMSVVVISILANIFYRHGIDVARAAKSIHGEQATLLALSGESWAMAILEEDAQNSSTDDLTENWAFGMPLLPVEGGSLTGEIIDLQSKFNLNSLAAYDTAAKLNNAINGMNASPRRNSYYAILSELLLALEAPVFPDQINTIVDWIDADNLAVPGGAEENDYLIKTPAYRTANQQLNDASELSLIEGFSPQIYTQLAPFITALPFAISSNTPQINVNTADIVLLQALHPRIDKTNAEALAQIRLETPWATLDEFYDSLATELGLATSGDAKALIEDGGFVPVSVSTEYFKLSLIVQLGSNKILLESLIQRTSGKVVILERTLTYLPSVLATTPTEAEE